MAKSFSAIPACFSLEPIAAVSTAETNDLKSKRAELKAMHDAMFGRCEDDGAKRINCNESIERASSETARRIAEKDFAIAGPEARLEPGGVCGKSETSVPAREARAA